MAGKNRRIRCVSLMCAVLMLLGGVTLFAGCGEQHITYVIEAGDELPHPYRLLNAEGAAYVAGFDESCVNRPGTHLIPMTDAAGNAYTLELIVRDRRRPVVTAKHVYYARGAGEPDPLDFIHTIEEADTYTAHFVGDVPDLSVIGDYDITFYVEDASGNRTKDIQSILTVIEDRTAPQFENVPELSAFVGEAIAYKKGLVVTDDCGGEIEVTVDSSAVNPNAAGDYLVRYTATDASGNASQAQTVIHIYEKAITEAQLYAQIDAVIATIIKGGMTKEQQLRAVYGYVYNRISYIPDSDKSDWVRAAYDALFVTGAGDCFNYYAATMAFCNRLGIEYRKIQRTPGAAEGTHYWIMVNIGTAEAPRWYHFDCTHIAIYGHSSCLLTDRQIRAFNRLRAGFYAYDASAYPASDSTIITQTPHLEKYY